MRIAVDLTELYDNFSGIERYACCRTLDLISRYPQHEYILLFKNEVHGRFQALAKAQNVQTVVLKGGDKLFFSQVTLPRAMKKLSYDLAFFFAYPAPYFLSHPERAVSAIHDMCVFDDPSSMTFKSRAFFRVLFRRAAKKDRALITVSHFSLGRILHYFPKAPKIIVSESGVDHFPKNGGKGVVEGRYILTLSTLEPRKNLRLLVNAFLEVRKRHPDLKLVLAGRKGWKVDDLLSGLPEADAKHIVCTGFVEDRLLPALYSGAECFVFPSRYEGFGLPPLEALSCGALVLSSDAASMPEVLGKGALYFRSDDREDLTRQLLRILNGISQEEREGLARAAEERLGYYTWARSTDELMKNL